MSDEQKEIDAQLLTRERKIFKRKITEQDRIIDDQCDTIIDLVDTLDARDMQ